MRVLTPSENNRLNELIGFLGVTIAILIGLALLSYSPHDPSFNVAANSVDSHGARNWIGPTAYPQREAVRYALGMLGKE